MLKPDELLEYKNKPKPSVYSVGAKEASDANNPAFDTAQLEAKLKNIEELVALERVRMVGLLSKAVWQKDIQEALVTLKVGPYWDVLGHSKESKTYLYPEEALYLIDIGGLELTFNEIPLSLQRAYYLLTTAGVSLENYRVFAHLSILGYKVMRHSSKNILTKYEKDIDIHKVGIKHKDVTREYESPKQNDSRRELAQEETCQINSKDISHPIYPIEFSEEDTKSTILAKIQSIGPRKAHFNSAQRSYVDYDVFSPKIDDSKFRKSTVQLPAIRLKVFSSLDPVPDVLELCRQQKYFEDGVPLVHAIVYPDYINFLQIAAVDIPDV